MTRRIDIEIVDKIDNSVLSKIQEIAKSAREAQHSINLMQKAVGGVNFSAIVKKTEAEVKAVTEVKKRGLTQQAKDDKAAKAEKERADKQAAASELREFSRLFGTRKLIVAAGRKEENRIYEKSIRDTKRAFAELTKDLDREKTKQDKILAGDNASASRIAKQYDTAQFAIERFQQEIAEANRLLSKGAIDAERYARIVSAINTKIDAPKKAAADADTAKKAAEAKVAADEVARLTKQYDSLGFTLDKLNADLEQVSSLYEKNAISGERYVRVVGDINRKIIDMTNSEAQAALAKTNREFELQVGIVEKLYRTYDPLQANINRAKSDLQALTAAFTKGAVSSAEYAGMVQRITSELQQLAAAPARAAAAKDASALDALATSAQKLLKTYDPLRHEITQLSAQQDELTRAFNAQLVGVAEYSAAMGAISGKIARVTDEQQRFGDALARGASLSSLRAAESKVSAQSDRDAAKAKRETDEWAASVANLTRKYDPLQAEINELVADQQRLNSAKDRNLLSDSAYERQMQQLNRQLSEVSGEQVKYTKALEKGDKVAMQSARSMRQQRQNLANLSFQLQDIGVSLASGQNPLLVLVQQGSQISQIYGAENGVRGALRGLSADLVKLGRVARGPLIVLASLAPVFALITREMNKGRKEQASFLQTTVATFEAMGKAIASQMVDVTKPLEDVLKPALKSTLDFMADFALSVVEKLTRGLMQITGLLTQFVSTALSSIEPLLIKLDSNVRILMVDIVNTVVDGVNTVADKSEQLINKLNVFSDDRIIIPKLDDKLQVSDHTLSKLDDANKKLRELYDPEKGFEAKLRKVIDDSKKFNLKESIQLELDTKPIEEKTKRAVETVNRLNESLQGIYTNSRQAFQQLGLNEYEKAVLDINTRVSELTGQYGALSAEQEKLIEGAKAFAEATVDFRRNEEVAELLKASKEAFDTAGLDDYQRAVLSIDNQVAELVKRYGSLTKAQQDSVDKAKEFAKQEVGHAKIKQILEETATPAERLKKELDELDKLRPYARTAKDLEAINRKMEALHDSVSEGAQIFKDFATDIGTKFTDVFQNIFDGGKTTFRSLTSDIYSIFTRMLARMATLALAKPLIIPVIQSVGSAMGVSKGAMNEVASEFGVSNMGDIGSFASLGSSFSKPMFAPGSMMAKGIDSVGSFFGMGTKSVGGFVGPMPADFVGPMPAAKTVGLSGAFTTGSTLAGMAGNIGANLLLGSDRGIGASLGGTAGSIAGTVIGAKMGTILGLAGGPVGALIGAFAGNALGGLFGNKKPSDKTQSGVVDISTGMLSNRRGLEGKKFSQENFDAVTQFSKIFGQLGQALGSKDKLTLVVGNRDGLRYQFNEGSMKKAADPGAFIKEITKQLNLGAPKISQSLSIALERIDFSQAKDNIEAVLSDINFAIAFDTLDFVPEKVSQIVAEFNELNNIFDEAQKTARRLGLEEKKITQKRDETIKTYVSDFNKANRNAIFSSALPQFQQLQELELQRQQAVKDATTIGGDVALVQLRYQRELEAILAQNFLAQSDILEKEQQRLQVANDLSNRFGSVVSSFDQLLLDLNVGRFTAKDPITRIDDFRGIVQDLANKARLNDVDAQEQLAKLLPDFLQLSEETYGASLQFAADLDFANKVAVDTRSAAQRQIDIQMQIASSAQKQVDLLQKMATLGGIGADQRFITGSFTGQTFSPTNPHSILIRAVRAGAIDESTATSLARAAGFYGRPGEGRAAAFFSENSTAAEALLRALQSGGLAGYAAGGTITGGVPNRDSVPILAMPGEYVIRASSARSVGTQTLNHVNQTGQLPSNDNGAVVGAIEKQTALLARMGDKLIELETRIANNTSGSNREAAAWL